MHRPRRPCLPPPRGALFLDIVVMSQKGASPLAQCHSDSSPAITSRAIAAKSWIEEGRLENSCTRLNSSSLSFTTSARSNKCFTSSGESAARTKIQVIELHGLIELVEEANRERLAPQAWMRTASRNRASRVCPSSRSTLPASCIPSYAAGRWIVKEVPSAESSNGRCPGGKRGEVSRNIVSRSSAAISRAAFLPRSSAPTALTR